MLAFVLIIYLGDFPFLTFGKLREFDSLKACREHIAEEAPPAIRERLDCLVLADPSKVKEA